MMPGKAGRGVPAGSADAEYENKVKTARVNPVRRSDDAWQPAPADRRTPPTALNRRLHRRFPLPVSAADQQGSLAQRLSILARKPPSPQHLAPLSKQYNG